MKQSMFKGGMPRLASGVAVAMLAVGLLGSQLAFAGIASTKHNLTPTTTGINKFTPTSGSPEMCVFCHTPHGADISAAVPLWNRTLSNPNTYQTYNSLGTSSLDGAIAPVGSVSLACLSCHDGTQALNTMINQPGSGFNISGTGNWAGTVTGANQVGGKLGGASVALLGTDLRNDHPVGIQYGGGPTAGTVPTPTGVTSAYSGFKDPDFNAASAKLVNNQAVWWVETGGNTTRDKTDLLLYSRTNADQVTYDATGVTRSVTVGALTGAQPFVECASCHDPHSSTNPTFLRISNANSGVCLTCHNK